MLTQCRSINTNGQQCSRTALPGRPYCWQHESKWLTFGSSSVIFGVVLLILATTADLIAVTEKIWVFVSPAATATLASTSSPTRTLVAMPRNTPTVVPDFTYTLRAIDKSTQQHITDVHVLIEMIGKAPLDGYSDVNGYVRLIVPKEHLGQPATIIVSADGYRTYRQAIDLNQGQLPAMILLEPLPLSLTGTLTQTEQKTPPAVPSGNQIAATPAPRFSAIYETFDGDVALDWQSFQGEWGVINNRLTVRSFDNEYAGITISNPVGSIYTFQVDMGTFQYLDDSGDPNVPFSHFHVIVNLQGNSDGYWFTVTNGVVSCDLYRNDTKINMQQSEAFSQWSEAYYLLIRRFAGNHTIEISVRSNKYLFRLDSHDVCSFQDSTFSQGALGIVVRQGASGRMWIDNVRLSPN